MRTDSLRATNGRESEQLVTVDAILDLMGAAANAPLEVGGESIRLRQGQWAVAARTSLRGSRRQPCPASTLRRGPCEGSPQLFVEPEQVLDPFSLRREGLPAVEAIHGPI